jgi:hypothetical protein
MSEARQPEGPRPVDFYTMRAGLPRMWADRQARRYVVAIPIITLVVPLILALTLPDAGPDPGFWLDLGHDWIIRGPITFLVVLFFLFVIMPVLLWRRRRRVLKRRRGY